MDRRQYDLYYQRGGSETKLLFHYLISGVGKAPNLYSLRFCIYGFDVTEGSRTEYMSSIGVIGKYCVFRYLENKNE